MNPPLPNLTIDTRDAQQCMALVAALPLTKTGYVHQVLTVLLSQMREGPPPPLSYLQVLEMARPAVGFVQEEMSARFAAKSVVPGSPEDKILATVVALWNLMARAYSQVAEMGGDQPEVQQRIALICHRCIHYAGKPILEYYRARRELPKGLWMDLHGYYSTAEEWEIADMPVAEPMNDYSKSQSCAQCFAATLLVDLGNPYSRPPRDYDWLSRWGQRFSIFTAVRPVEEGCDARTYAVDLDRDQGLRPLELVAGNPQVRRLDTTRLSQEMHTLAQQLKLKVPPADLGLGENAFEPATSKLLMSLYRPWCMTSSPRRFQRRNSAGTAETAYGFEAIHYFVKGDEFVQPSHVRTYSRAEFEEIATFRHQVDPTERLHVRVAQIAYATESWEVVDQSVSGFRLHRGRKGERVEHGQLLGMRPPDGDSFLLCVVSWLMYGLDGSLTAGVYVLPGVPAAIAIRASGPTVSHSEKYIRAFMLPEMKALKEPASLVLPKSWIQPARVLDVYSGSAIEARLVDALTQGYDVDRVSYEALRPQGQAG